MNNNYTVYIHTNKINGYKYIGITQQDPEVRWQGGNGYRRQGVFWNAIKKYGWDNFIHEIVARGLIAEDAYALEKELIAKYDSTNRFHGYNRSIGGESGAKGVEKNENQRRAASEALKRQWENPVFREACMKRFIETMQTEEAKRKRAESRKGIKYSEEARRRMSAARKGIKPPPFTEEHKRRIRENHAGGADKRAVICLETNIIYESINDAARNTNINKKGISGCCRNVQHYNTAGGFHWKFVNED